MAGGQRPKHRHGDQHYYQPAYDSAMIGPQPMFPQPMFSQPMVDPATLWTGWHLSDTGVYYYRYRKISYEAAQMIVDDARNRVSVDAQGACFHYELMALKDMPQGGHLAATTNAYQTAPISGGLPLINFLHDAPQYQFPMQQQQQQLPGPQFMLQPPEVYYDDDDDDDWASGTSENSGTASSRQRQPTVIDVDDTPEGLKITFPTVSDDHLIVCDRKSKKRSDYSRRPRSGHKSKGDTWREKRYY